jgi:hypothetical protein
LRGTTVVEDAEVLAHLLGDLVRQRVSAVVHREHDALDASSGLYAALHAVDGGHQVREPLERVELALQRHEHARRRPQRVDGQQAERGRAIEDDVS